jgi:membrane protein implicated in regulation of membrane protease activity
MNRQLNLLVIPLAVLGLLLYTASAEAYIGPGAGLSLLGALWALVAAVVAALGFIVLWPIRQSRKRRLARQQAETNAVAHDAAPRAMDKTPEAPMH